MPYHIFFRRIRRRIRQKSLNHKEYLLQRESARTLVMERLIYFVGEYAKLDPILAQFMKYNHVSIRNQRRRWGSCSSKKNLNFNYRILTLSPELRDYIIVHELCHLKELHHGKTFWDLVERIIPDGQALNMKVRHIKFQ